MLRFAAVRPKSPQLGERIYLGVTTATLELHRRCELTAAFVIIVQARRVLSDFIARSTTLANERRSPVLGAVLNDDARVLHAP